ncbi:MAG: hypothetical protein JSU94_06155 [Phycisphaerales bacterium]|nr:MAG: hypothetical protein JSU94_06155 [Phycisphaerales bacterium]
MSHIIVTAELILLCLWGAASTTGAEPQPSLAVEVTNGTDNGASVVGDEVLLVLYEREKPIDSVKSKVNEKGRAVFENVPTGDHIRAVAKAKHQNMMFDSQVISLAPGPNPLKASVKVFDVSTDKSKLSVGMHHFIIKTLTDALRITEYMQLKNASDKAITSQVKDSNDRDIVLEVSLPAGFKDVACSSYFEEHALVITDQGFYDTMAVPPGIHNAAFSYTLAIDGRAVDIGKKLSLPTSEFMLFSQVGDDRVRGLGSPIGQVTLSDGGSAEYYSYPDPKLGEEIRFQVVGFNPEKRNHTGLLVLCVVFAAVGTVIVRRIRAGSK